MECFAPQETTICDGLYSSRLSFLNFAAIASRNSCVPEVGVYFVSPFSMAAMAAALMDFGVSKSGSPAAKFTTSWPLAFNSLALAVMASVADPTISLMRRFMHNVKVPNRTFLKKIRLNVNYFPGELEPRLNILRMPLKNLPRGLSLSGNDS